MYDRSYRQDSPYTYEVLRYVRPARTDRGDHDLCVKCSNDFVVKLSTFPFFRCSLALLYAFPLTDVSVFVFFSLMV